VSAPFVFLRDIKRVQWGPTLQVNLFRAVAAGFVLGVLSLIPFFASMFDRRPGVAWPLLTTCLASPFFMPLTYFLILLPLGLLGALLCAIASKIENVVGTIIGLMSAGFVLFAALAIMLGDPLMYFLHRYKPTWVPIERYPFVGFCMTLFVLRPVVAH